ncbi:hypothetical protein [Lentzea sp. NPDC051838]|uniref:hypothetical protein n=1 Tax=Lentzea sp. NPDC051838 TaxID=3154849 RepID=UPI00342DB244
MAVVIMLVLALLGGNAHALAAPQPVLQQAPANTEPTEPVDEELEFYKQLVGDIRDHAEDVEVRDAAAAALTVGTKERLVWFLDVGLAEAQTRAEQRKSVERAENRKKVDEWARTGGPNVKAGAQAALNAGDRAIADFVAFGYEIALKRDKQQAEDDKAEQDRIIARVKDMVAHGGPQVQLEGGAILESKDYPRIREFYLTGYHEAHKRDADFQKVIEKALEDRNRAVAELDQLARRSTAAADARAEIMRANIDAVKHLDDVLFAMRMSVKAAHKADRIFQEDKAGRANGQRGRDQELDAARAEAAEYAARAERVATLAESTTQRARNAAERLVDSGMTNGLDWAKVTIGIGSAVSAAASAAEAAQQAAVATLADSRALDADRNAQEHAGNAQKYLAEAKRQELRAAELAEAAKKQQEIAAAARDRAARQKEIAQQKAAQAQQHAANARGARVNAQGAATNAAVKAKGAFEAYARAGQLAAEHDAAMGKVRKVQTEVDMVTTLHSMRLIGADRLQGELEAAEQRAREQGQNVEEVTREIRGQATTARSEANAAAAWAERARAAAAAARAEAQRAETAARDARAAAARANGEAVTARRAADEAHRLTLEATNAALASRASAEMTQQEAEAAVREANQSVFQSVIADRAAAAASAAASIVVDSARVAEAILRQFAGVSADARKALEVTSQALLVGEEQSRSAREKADEADKAAISARKAATDALDTVKPAYEAAARAAESAKTAAQHALNATNAADDAAKQAAAAHGAASTATQWSNTARQDAVLAGNAAALAGASAASANRAASATEQIADLAEEANNQVQQFLEHVAERVKDVHEFRLRRDMAEQIAREEAERKRQELNNKFAAGLAWAAVCSEGPSKSDLVNKFCRDGLDRLKNYANRAADTMKDGLNESLLQAARCAGGDEHACQIIRDGQTPLQQFRKTVGEGIVESATGALDGLIALGDCVTFGLSSCRQIAEGLWYTLQNPHVMIHLEEWLDNPAKAIGMTWFDLTLTLSTAGIGSGGTAITKGLGTFAKGVGRGAGKFLKDVAHLESLLTKLADNIPTRLPNPLVEVLNLQARMENGLVKIDGAIAEIDGQLYRVERIEVRPDGDLTHLDGSIVRLEIDKLRIEGGIAKVENPRVKFEQPKPCGTAVRAAAGDCVPSYREGRTDPNTGIYTARENHKEIELSAQENSKADELLRKAEELEGPVTTVIERLRNEIPGAERRGETTARKGEESLKRKLDEALRPERKEGDTSPLPTLQAALRKINDSLRYTLVFPEETYTLSVMEGLRKLDANPDIRVTVVKNKWATNMAQEGENYKGINITLETKDGFQFELQLHTPASYTAKEAEHGLYELARTARTKEEKDAIQLQSDKIFGQMKTPVGAPGIPQR